jgi:hypothetical protein
MQKLFPALIICFALYSCKPLQIAETKKDISDLGISWELAKKVNPVYKEKIDSVFEAIINRFNSEKHSFSVHKRLPFEQNFLALNFEKGKFVKKGGLTAGYIVSGVGLLVAPAAILYATEGMYILGFYYFPMDNLAISGSLSPALSGNKTRPLYTLVQTGALFSNKTKRMKKISKKLDQRIYKILLQLDKQLLLKK